MQRPTTGDRELGIEPERGIPVQVCTPGAGEVFDGTATGTFDPPAPPPPTITVKLWLHADTSGAPYKTMTASIVGRTGWSATFDMTGVGATADAVVRAEKGGDNSQSTNLSWTPGTSVIPLAKADGKPAAALVPAPILITRPRPGGKVGFLFLVHGDFTPGDHNKVEVHLFRPGGHTPANALILPTVYLTETKWVTSVFAFEGGENYVVRATLKKKTGDTIISHSVGLITIG